MKLEVNHENRTARDQTRRWHGPFRVKCEPRPEEGWERKCSNKVRLMSRLYPDWSAAAESLFLPGTHVNDDTSDCCATESDYARIVAAVAESNAMDEMESRHTEYYKTDAMAKLADDVANLQIRVAALEAADPVQDDAGSGFTYTESDKSYIQIPPTQDDIWSQCAPSPEKLRMLADWLDAKHGPDQYASDDVQQDLRRWADSIEKQSTITVYAWCGTNEQDVIDQLREELEADRLWIKEGKKLLDAQDERIKELEATCETYRAKASKLAVLRLGELIERCEENTDMAKAFMPLLRQVDEAIRMAQEKNQEGS